MKQFGAALLAIALSALLGIGTPAFAKSKSHQAVEDDDGAFYANPVEMNFAWSEKVKGCRAKKYENTDADCRALISISNEAVGHNLCFGTNLKWSKCHGSGAKLWIGQADLTDGICRGGPDSESCYARTAAMLKAQSLGWCWGHDGQTEFEKRWERCSRKSLRISPENDE